MTRTEYIDFMLYRFINKINYYYYYYICKIYTSYCYNEEIN